MTTQEEIRAYRKTANRYGDFAESAAQCGGENAEVIENLIRQFEFLWYVDVLRGEYT